MLTAAQIRAARAMLNWSGPQLAVEASLSLPTIRRMESELGPGRSTVDNVTAVKRACERAGIIFIYEDTTGGPGVRVKS